MSEFGARGDATDRTAVARALDLLAFSPAIPAGLAYALTWTVGETLSPMSPRGALVEIALLAAGGAAVVYGLDRLRDRDRDRRTSPRRTAFIERQRRLLVATSVAAALLVVVELGRAPLDVAVLCAVLGGAGVMHRRLKRFGQAKTLYVSLAWTGVCVGLPWLGLAGPHDASAGLGLGALLLPTFAANLVASNLRDQETHWLRGRPTAALRVARALALAGVAAALLGPAVTRPFAWIPAALAGALAAYRPTEHYGHLAVDGALLLGTLATATHIVGLR